MTSRSESCSIMDKCTFEQRYLRLNKLVGVLSGLWPGQSKISKTLATIVAYTIVVESVIVQVAYVARDYSFDRLIAQIPYLCLALLIAGKHMNYALYGTKVKELLNIIVKDWEVQRPKEELAILENYSNRAALLSMIYTVCIFSSSFMFSIQPIVPHILDVLIPLNESRGRVLVYPAYFFMDEDKYYYFIIINEIMGSLEIFLVYSSCDMYLVWFIQHASCKLAINWYNFQKAMAEERTCGKEDKHLAANKTYSKVCLIIADHQRVVEYIETVAACHVTVFIVILAFVTFTFTVTLLKMSKFEMTLQYLTFCVFMFAQVIHVLFICSMGQYLNDAIAESYNKIYESNWYNGSTRTQLLYQLVLRKYLSFPKITAGGVIPMDLNTFVQIIKASFSYYTVLKSND